MSNETNFPIPPQPTVELHKLPPFPRFCCTIGMIPSSYKIAMSYEEQLMWLCKFLEETVIPTINENTDATNSVILKYNEIVDFLNHYFDNLDVQEEINNKLDQMAEDGYFDEILRTYIDNSFIQYFDNVQALKSANLSTGQIVGTKGYYTIGDGGKAIYFISNTPSSIWYEQLNNNLYANILIEANIFIPEQFGIKNDASSDCSLILNHIFSVMPESSIFIGSGKYLVNSKIYLPNKNNITIKGGTFIAGEIINDFMFNVNPTKIMQYSGWEWSTENLTIENVLFNANFKTSCLYLDSYLRTKISNCTFHNFSQYAIYTENGHEAQIISSNFIGKSNNDEDVENTGIYLNSHDNIIDSCVFAYCQWGIDIHQSSQQICNSHFYCNRANGGNVKISQTSFIVFSNNYFDGSGIYAINPWKLSFTNNLFYVTNSSNHIIKFELTSASIRIRGIYFMNNQINDGRTDTTTPFPFIECNRSPNQVIDCKIDMLAYPASISFDNPYAIFALSPSNITIIPNSGFRATNIEHVIGNHYSLDNFYNITYQDNYINSEYIGDTSIFPWAFIKIYVPAKTRLSRELLNNTSSAMDVFDENENYLGHNNVTVDKGIYYIGFYRTCEMIISSS